MCAGFAIFLSITSSFVAAMALVQNHVAFIIIRLCIGFGLATFVSNQYWTSSLFTPSLVGIANAVAGGWGNAGVCVSHILILMQAQSMILCAVIPAGRARLPVRPSAAAAICFSAEFALSLTLCISLRVDEQFARHLLAQVLNSTVQFSALSHLRCYMVWLLLVAPSSNSD